MVKFIVEVDEKFIRDHAHINVDKAADSDGKSVLVEMMNFVAYSRMEKQINEGKTEFVFKSEDFEDNSAEMFEHTLSNLCALNIVSSKNEKDGSDK